MVLSQAAGGGQQTGSRGETLETLRKAESIHQGATPGRQCLDLAGTSPKSRMCGIGARRELASHQDQGHCWVFPGEPASSATISDRQTVPQEETLCYSVTQQERSTPAPPSSESCRGNC